MTKSGQSALRARPLACARCAALLVALALPSSALAGALHIDADSLPCRDRARIVARIGERVTDLLDSKPDLALAIRPEPAGSLTLVLSSASGSTQRVVAFNPSECATLSESVSLLMRGWLGRGWKLPTREVAAPEPPPAPPAPALVTAKTHPTDALRPRPQVRAVLLSGAFASGHASDAGFAAKAAAEWDPLPSLGASIFAGFDGPATTSAGSGHIAVSTWSIALAARWILQPLDAGRLEFVGGAGIEVLGARASGFASTTARRVVTPAMVLGARWRQHLTGPLAAVGGVEVTFRRPQTLYVRNVEEEFALAPQRVRLLAGLAWDLD